MYALSKSPYHEPHSTTETPSTSDGCAARASSAASASRSFINLTIPIAARRKTRMLM